MPIIKAAATPQTVVYTNSFFLKNLHCDRKNALNKIIIAFVFVIQQLSSQDLLQANIWLHEPWLLLFVHAAKPLYLA